MQLIYSKIIWVLWSNWYDGIFKHVNSKFKSTLRKKV